MPLGLRSLIAVAGLHLALTNVVMLADLHRTDFSIAARSSGRRAPARRIWSGRQRSTQSRPDLDNDLASGGIAGLKRSRIGYR